MPKICRTCSAFSSSMTACPPLISVKIVLLVLPLLLPLARLCRRRASSPFPLGRAVSGGCGTGRPKPCADTVAPEGWGEGLLLLPDLHTVFLNCIITQFKPQPGLVR